MTKSFLIQIKPFFEYSYRFLALLWWVRPSSGKDRFSITEINFRTNNGYTKTLFIYFMNAIFFCAFLFT
jgi:hypothetical protein